MKADTFKRKVAELEVVVGLGVHSLGLYGSDLQVGGGGPLGPCRFCCRQFWVCAQFCHSDFRSVCGALNGCTHAFGTPSHAEGPECTNGH